METVLEILAKVKPNVDFKNATATFSSFTHEPEIVKF